MTPSRSGRTLVRRVVGVIAVLFLLGCAVAFYGMAPDLPTSASGRSTTASPSNAGSPTASPPTANAPTGVPSSASPPTARPSSVTPPETSDSQPTTSTETSGAGSPSSSAEKTIEVEKSAYSARPFQTVRILGIYHGGPNTFLQVQRLEQGQWVTNPLPTKTDDQGRFSTGVELGPGSYWLRILDPASGVASEPFAVMIKA